MTLTLSHTTTLEPTGRCDVW